MGMRQVIIVIAGFAIGALVMAAVVWFILHKFGASDLVLKKTGADKMLPPGVREGIENATDNISDPGRAPAASGATGGGGGAAAPALQPRGRQRWWKWGRGQ
jgi:hypothetical protein